MTDIPFATRLADSTFRKFFRWTIPERFLLWLYQTTNIPFLLKLAPAHYTYPVGTIRKAYRRGIHYQIDLSTYHGWMIYYHRSEPEKIARFVKPGDTVIDIGANIGEVALSCAKRAGPQGRVVAFEPNPPTFAALRVNRELNPALSVVVENLALGDRAGEVSMVQLDGRNPGTTTIKPGNKSEGEMVDKVPMLTLDSYAENHLSGPVHLIKIDVEGYESFVLTGAVSIIQRNKPVLLVELCDQHQKMHGGSARALVAQIKALGYQVTCLGDETRPVSDAALDGCNIDVTCTPC